MFALDWTKIICMKTLKTVSLYIWLDNFKYSCSILFRLFVMCFCRKPINHKEKCHIISHQHLLLGAQQRHNLNLNLYLSMWRHNSCKNVHHKDWAEVLFYQLWWSVHSCQWASYIYILIGDSTCMQLPKYRPTSMYMYMDALTCIYLFFYIWTNFI